MSQPSRLAMACAVAAAAALSSQVHAETATGKLLGSNGENIGTVTVTEAPKGVLLRIEASGLTPGWHGLHFHEKGDCSSTGFTSAGGHVHSVTPVVHGFLNAEANDAGDLPNIWAHEDGKAVAEFYSTYVSLKQGGDRPALLDADGSSVVIHANPDDYSSQPIGGAGDRVACAVLE